MNTLPLLIGGIIVFAVMQNKKSPSKPIIKDLPKKEDPIVEDPENVDPKDIEEDPPKKQTFPNVGSKEIGYEIINCEEIIIYDAPKALQYAFNVGKNLPVNYEYNSANLDKKLFGNCLNNFMFNKNNAGALFFFDLMKHGYSGLFFTVGGNETLVTNPLNKFKKELEDRFEIDTSGFIVEVIK